MTEKLYRIHIKKEALKFSAAHMTVFPDGTKEPLHGHNYEIELTLTLTDASLARMISFSTFKRLLRDLCVEWDEKVLLAEDCPHYTVNAQSNTELDFTLCKKRYVLPMDEVVLLKLDNITTESLSEDLCRRFLAKLGEPSLWPTLREISIRINESSGQGASFQCELPRTK